MNLITKLTLRKVLLTASLSQIQRKYSSSIYLAATVFGAANFTVAAKAVDSDALICAWFNLRLHSAASDLFKWPFYSHCCLSP
jgi:hypothetical protein